MQACASSQCSFRGQELMAPATDPRIHFAGTEWPASNGGMYFGYVEGAVASGLAAAEAILERLGLA